MKWNFLQKIALSATLVITPMISACSPTPSAWKAPNMTSLTPRLKSLFEKQKTVCFGRFIIDIPQAATVAWGEVHIPLSIIIYKNDADKISERITQAEEKLKSEPRFPKSKKLSLYFETISSNNHALTHVVGQQDFSSTGMLKIDSFFIMGQDLVKIESRPLEEEKEKTIFEIHSIADRLRPRSENETPAESGNCLDNAFLPDGPHIKNGEFWDHIRVGIRLNEFPDTHLSIYLAPSNPDNPEGDSLEFQFKRTEEAAKNSGKTNPYASLKFFRKGKREIYDWQTGYEILTRTPDEANSHSHHDFWMKFVGVASDMTKPYADIQLNTGVENNVAGAKKPSLTDEEAVALWDKITSSIRVRPIGGALKTSAALPSKFPLGELVSTGYSCPETGWWECVDHGNVQGGRRQRFRIGECMPNAVLLGKSNLWQKLSREQSTHQMATVWKLVGYDEPMVTFAVPNQSQSCNVAAVIAPSKTPYLQENFEPHVEGAEPKNGRDTEGNA